MEMHAGVVVCRLAVCILLLAFGAMVEPQAVDTAEQLHRRGIENYRQSSYQHALRDFSAALEIDRQAGYKKGEATALTQIAMCLDALGQKHAALDYLEKALPMWQ